ncbi:unnamed protein product [Linum tenue]|uniref:Growth-regulating factor n=1 Tax=Linum tenue TaxID=586396 RepID=A0AAV0PRZ4_9ROSI|nr:unnamed protein product [Linum tenue]
MLSNARAGNRSSSSCSSSPFTATQWQELEHQALIYKYMVSGVPIPPELLFSVGWGCFQVGFGKKGDPEPGRCRRTDGKKWRCSKEAYPGSKYCDRHMHRGKNRSRKPVEISSSSSSPSPSTATNASRTSPNCNNTTTTTSNNNYYHNPYLTSYNNPSLINPLSISSSTSSLDSDVHQQQAPLNGHNFLNSTFLYNTSTNTSSCSNSSSCSKTTPTPTPNLFMDSLSSSHPTSDKDYRYLQGVREDQQLQHHQYGSSPQPEFDNFYSYPSSKQDYHNQQQHCFVLGADFKSSSSSSSISAITNRPLIKVEEGSNHNEEMSSSSSHKPMHHFFGLGGGGGADSWLDLASSSRPS